MNSSAPSDGEPINQPNPDIGERHRSRTPSWIVGAILILVGLGVLASNLTGFSLNNWWALFILIPAMGSLAAAWRMYQANGNRFTQAARGPLVGGLILLCVTAIFLFNLNWAGVWPVLLIIVGIGAVLTAL